MQKASCTAFFTGTCTGVFTSLEQPYAHFQTASTTGPELYSIVWEGTQQLEGLGFKVKCISCDGAAPNRKFFKMHGNYGLKNGVIHTRQSTGTVRTNKT